MCAPIDSADGETKDEVKSDDDQRALYLGTDSAADDSPCAEESKDCTRCTD